MGIRKVPGFAGEGRPQVYLVTLFQPHAGIRVKPPTVFILCFGTLKNNYFFFTFPIFRIRKKNIEKVSQNIETLYIFILHQRLSRSHRE